MKIFFLTQFYFDLYKPIYEELVRQGHDVYIEKDVCLPFDYNFSAGNKTVKSVRKVLRKLFHIETLYWKNKIHNNPAYNESYDVLICIDGVSFSPFLINHLKKYNPKLKATLYLWDSSKYYDFFRYNYCFDKVFTFDIDDANLVPNVKVLHSYWTPVKNATVTKYKIFMVGSDHDDRIDIVSKIYSQIKTANVPSFIKIVINKPQTNKQVIDYILSVSKKKKKKIIEWEKKSDLPFTTTECFKNEDIIKYISESECVLDTDMPIQTGATQRVIWALAQGKKIISTNTSLKRMPFYKAGQISFIDRRNPVLDMKFLNEKKVFPISDEISNLRIDKWIHQLIDF